MWDHMYRYDGGGHWGWGSGWFGGPFMLLILIVIIVAVVMVVWAVNQNRNSGRIERSNAIEILKERYARGEINLEEFEERKRNLEK